MKRETRAILLLVAMALLAACDETMREGARYKAYEPSTFFADGRVARPLPPNTVAQGDALRLDDLAHTGRDDNGWAASNPLPITEPMLRRGQLMFNVFCANCHGQAGYGDGMIVRRGYPMAADFHTSRLRSLPDGHVFNVISEGYGKMPAYRSMLAPPDRWAIIAYLRVLQESQSVPVDRLPDEARAKLEREATP